MTALIPVTNIVTVAAQQYFAVAEIMLRLFNPSPVNGHICQADLDFVEDRALRICGLACTNDDVSGKVNAFGPLAFCETSYTPFFELNELIVLLGGRYLTREHHQIALETLLVGSSTLTGWPVHLIIQDLKHHWEMSP